MKGVTDNIVIRSDAQDTVEKKEIELAFVRAADIEDEAIHVEVSGNVVTLTGTVASPHQKEQAERLAWNAAGVGQVNNELLIGSNERQPKRGHGNRQIQF